MLSFITNTKETTWTSVEAKFCFGCAENAQRTTFAQFTLADGALVDICRRCVAR